MESRKILEYLLTLSNISEETRIILNKKKKIDPHGIWKISILSLTEFLRKLPNYTEFSIKLGKNS